MESIQAALINIPLTPALSRMARGLRGSTRRFRGAGKNKDLNLRPSLISRFTQY